MNFFPEVFLLRVFPILNRRRFENTLLARTSFSNLFFFQRYYQEQKYDEINGILDRFQRRFPGVVVTLLGHACDTVMFDIMPSQYSNFVQMLRVRKSVGFFVKTAEERSCRGFCGNFSWKILTIVFFKDMKSRLESINRQDDWNDFFNVFKKKHTGKKKYVAQSLVGNRNCAGYPALRSNFLFSSRLMQMVSLIGDSVWDLDSVMARPKKKLKTEPKKKGGKRKKGDDDE